MDEARTTDAVPPSLWQKLRGRQILGVSLAVAVLTGAYMYLLAGRVYTAETTLLLSTRPDLILALVRPDAALQTAASAGVLDLIGRGGPLSRLQAVLKSRQLAETLVERYQLEQRLNLDRERALKAIERMTRLEVTQGPGLLIRVTVPGPSRVGEWQGSTRPFGTLEARLAAAQMANDYVALLDEQITRMNVTEAESTREFLEERQQEVTAELEEVENQLQVLQTQYTLLDPDKKATQLVEQMSALHQALAQAGARAEGLRLSVQAARGRLSQQESTRISREVTERNPVIVEMERRQAELQTELARALESGKSAAHPEVLELQAALDSVAQERRAVAEKVQQQVWREADPTHDALLGKTVELEVELAGAEAQRSVYAGKVAELESSAAELPAVVREYLRLMREQRVKTELLATLVKHAEMTALEEKREQSGLFQVLDEAVPPLRKSGPATVKTTVLVFLLVAFLMTALNAYRAGMLRLPAQE